MSKVHGTWGLPLSEYVPRYTKESKPLFESDADIERLLKPAKLGIQQIMDIHDHASNQDPIYQVSLSFLQSVSNLGYYPPALRYFACPSLVRGCIKLASLVKYHEKPSPFNYEYGYFCFRIIAISINACLLDRSHNLDVTIDSMTSSPEDVLESLAERTSFFLTQKLTNIPDDQGFNWILGWEHPVSLPLQHRPLISRLEASLLLELLWVDRKMFPNAVFSTDMPGWTHLGDRKCVGQKYYEILWRYHLVASKLENRAINPFDQNMQSGPEGIKWVEDIRAVDLEDSRQVILTFLSRAEPDSDSNQYKSASPVTALFQFVCSFVQPGVEDLLALLFKSVIECIWDDLRCGATAEEKLILSIISFLANIARMLKVFPLPLETQVELVEAMIQGSLVDLTARLIIIVELASPIGPFDDLRKEMLLTALRGMYRMLPEVISKPLLKEKLADSFFNWLNFRLHLLWRTSILCHGAPSTRDELIRLGSKLWDEIGSLIGQNPASFADRLVTALDSNAQNAPHLTVALGAKLWTGLMVMVSMGNDTGMDPWMSKHYLVSLGSCCLAV
ncbi:hypothetical protein OPQ81_000572 [Rhizoctonia solani]|nr:hypothetical protein OPQ81_000572 [Rhizoctonia solani]